MTQTNDILLLTLFAEYLCTEDKFRLQRVSTKWRKILIPFSWQIINVTEHFKRVGPATAFQQFKENGKFIRSIIFTKEAPELITKLLSFTFILETFEKTGPINVEKTKQICESLVKRVPNIAHIRLVYSDTSDKIKMAPLVLNNLKSLILIKPAFNEGDLIFRSFISGSGMSIRCIHYSSSTIGEDIIHSLNQYCLKLTALKLVGKLTSVALVALNQYPSIIKHLTLNMQNRTSTAIDSFTLFAKNFQSLSHFSLRGDSDLAANTSSRHPTFEATFPEMKILNIHTVTMAGFLRLPDFFPNLETLSLFNCCNITNNVVRRIIMLIPNLKNLRLSGNAFDDGAFDIPIGKPFLKLRRLALTGSKSFGSFFTKFLFNSVPNLSWLDVSFVPIIIPEGLSFAKVASEARYLPATLFFIDISFCFQDPLLIMKLIAALPGLVILQIGIHDPNAIIQVKKAYPNLEIRIVQQA